MAVTTVTTEVYSMSEWRLAVIGEATLGTPNVTTMQLINIDSDVSVTSEVIQTLDVRSGVGRTLKTADVYTSDYGQLTSISFSCILDRTVSTILHSNAFGLAAAGSPSGYAMAYDYAPAAVLNGTGSLTVKDALTFALISPQSGETRVFGGACVPSLKVTYDPATDGGRGHAEVKAETRYRPADGAATPSSMAAFGTIFGYLRDFNALKQFAPGASGFDVVVNKLAYEVINPVAYLGFQGASGNPEMLRRASPSAGFKLMVGVKYDSTTASYWENRRAGTTMSFEISNNAAWAGSTFGVKAAYLKLDSDVVPSGTDAGVFQDLSFTATASTSGEMARVVISS